MGLNFWESNISLSHFILIFWLDCKNHIPSRIDVFEASRGFNSQIYKRRRNSWISRTKHPWRNPKFVLQQNYGIRHLPFNSLAVGGQWVVVVWKGGIGWGHIGRSVLSRCMCGFQCGPPRQNESKNGDFNIESQCIMMILMISEQSTIVQSYIIGDQIPGVKMGEFAQLLHPVK